ncbi:MAG: helix-turn-helix transcriptional regulator [Eubacterium sp.]|nr:helix-turn-helix transcriptional regulator [Eubacterium sp.]
MTIYLSENLRRLRKEKGLTQEALAERLGVAFQTVSKWERGETYPDITLLPVLASLFETTVDGLLGADKAKKEEKVKEYLSLYENMCLKDVSSVLNEYKKAVREFPDDFSILINYMELLHIEKGSINVNDYKPLSRELTSVYERIQRYCTTDSIRIRSKRIMVQHLIWQYQCLGWRDTSEPKFNIKYKKQAEKVLETLPSLSDSKEYLSLSLNESYEGYTEAIEELTYLLQNAVVGYSYYNDEFSPREKIDIIESMNGIILLTDRRDKPSKNRIHLIYNYGHLGHLYSEAGDNKTALKYLRLAAETAAAFDKLPDTQERTALFYERENRFRDMNMRSRTYELMTEHYPLSEELRASEEFNSILNIIKQRPSP